MVIMDFVVITDFRLSRTSGLIKKMPDTSAIRMSSICIKVTVRTSSVSYIRRVDEVSWLYFSYTKMRRQ